MQIQRGRNGGVFISDSYKLPVNFMTKEEYGAAIEALGAMYSQLPEERFLAARRKLSAQAKSESRDLTLSGTVGTILVDSGTWGDTRSFSEKLRLFEGCIRDCAVLEVDYNSRMGEHTHRRIEPHVLVFKQSVWYVYAFCRKKRAFRLFRLGRITAVLTGEKFIRRPFRRRISSTIDGRNLVGRCAPEVSEEAFADVQDWPAAKTCAEPTKSGMRTCACSTTASSSANRELGRG
ncbi:MAG: helix-turn-helix transcriptional regulator [Christensenellaceae bacterium]